MIEIFFKLTRCLYFQSKSVLQIQDEIEYRVKFSERLFQYILNISGGETIPVNGLGLKDESGRILFCDDQIRL